MQKNHHHEAARRYAAAHNLAKTLSYIYCILTPQPE